MKQFLSILCLFLVFTSCSGVAEEPANLLTKSQMSEILAEMAINDQAIILDAKANLESGTRFILQKNKIKPQDFIDSYQYYAVNGKIESIIENAQKIVMDKDPGAEKYIKQKLKESPEITGFGR